MTEGWVQRLPTAGISHVAEKQAKMWRRSRLGGHDGRLRAADTASDVGACSECGHARIPWKYLTHMAPAEGKADAGRDPVPAGFLTGAVPLVRGHPSRMFECSSRLPGLCVTSPRIVGMRAVACDTRSERRVCGGAVANQITIAAAGAVPLLFSPLPECLVFWYLFVPHVAGFCNGGVCL